MFRGGASRTWISIWAGALLFGDEWPSVAVKNLTTGEQQLVPNQELLAYLAHSLSLSS
jgi:hypothetical protein